MLESVNKIASIVGADRATVQRRADQFGLEAQDGPKQAKLYDTRKLVQLVPAPTRAANVGDSGESTLEEARIRQTNADAQLKEIEIEERKGRLADVAELMETQNTLFDEISTQIKNSTLPEADKEDLLSSILSAAEKWANS